MCIPPGVNLEQDQPDDISRRAFSYRNSVSPSVYQSRASYYELSHEDGYDLCALLELDVSYDTTTRFLLERRADEIRLLVRQRDYLEDVLVPPSLAAVYSSLYDSHFE